MVSMVMGISVVNSDGFMYTEEYLIVDFPAEMSNKRRFRNLFSEILD